MNLVDASDEAVWEAIRRISVQAFAFEGVGEQRYAQWDQFTRLATRDTFHAWVDGDAVLGGLCVYKCGQWFGGRAVPMAGVAVVGVDLAHRGRGVGSDMVAARLHLAREEGYALSTLYASTQGPYRKVGYEQAGSNFRWSMPTEAAPLLDRSLPVEPIRPDDPIVRGVHRLRAVTTPGNLDRSDAMWARLAREHDAPVYAWLLGTRDDPQGYVVYDQARGADVFLKLSIRDAAALTPLAVRRFWTLIADHRSIAREIGWFGPANEPLLVPIPEQRATVTRAERWMLRVVDVERALTLRGYPAGADEELHFEVVDPVIAANHGRFVLRVKDGVAEVASGGRGDLQASVGSLAPLYSGYYRASELARMGLVDGSAPALGAADRLFAGPEPWMADRF